MPIARAVVDYYRCPEQFVKMALAGELSADEGFFRLGSTIAFGATSYGTRAASALGPLDDVAPALSADYELVRVPFDPSQVVDNLRLERYVAASAGPGPRSSLLRKPYYSLRPFIPAALRRTLQRSYLRDWQRLPFPRWPVDTSVDQIFRQLLHTSLRSHEVTRIPFVWFWPNGAASCAIVTHDVETATGRDRCSWLMDIDDSYGIKSSFQIVPEDRYAVSPAFLDSIRTRGFEINLHDLNHDGRLFSDPREFRRRAEKINGYAREFGARGFRSGQMYRRPDWLDALDISYDMSLPNVAHLDPQRGGCCTVMPYFVGKTLELPLTLAQDYTLFHILRDYSNDIWNRQIDAIVRDHGLVSVIIHPDYLKERQEVASYRALLARLASLRDTERTWVTLPAAVDHWWRQRSRMTLVRDGERWRIEGEGKERARIAWAELGDGGAVYRVDDAPSE